MMADTLSRARFFLAFLLDCLAAPQFDPAETLVVSGFWRSGTTWVQELLAGWLDAKTIFEPFHLYVPQTQGLFMKLGIASRSPEFRELFVPYWPPNQLEKAEALLVHYRRALKSTLRGRAVRALRAGWAESWRRRIVVKLTRGQLSLAAAQKTFGFPLLHISRDPRAVVASVRMTDWAWLFDHLTPADLLLGGGDGRAALFAGREAEIQAAGNAGAAGRIATYWAALESGLFESGPTGSTARLRYEDLLQSPEAALREALAQVGIDPPTSPLGERRQRASYSTSQGRRKLSTEERLYAWKTVLTPEEIGTITAIAHRFGLGATLLPDDH